MAAVSEPEQKMRGLLHQCMVVLLQALSPSLVPPITMIPPHFIMSLHRQLPVRELRSALQVDPVHVHDDPVHFVLDVPNDRVSDFGYFRSALSLSHHDRLFIHSHPLHPVHCANVLVLFRRLRRQCNFQGVQVRSVTLWSILSLSLSLFSMNCHHQKQTRQSDPAEPDL